ncbi:MAG TPA: hypothetical protein DCS90_18535 [Ktedonobacter sp.]|nr:hypothetical protein [Ktedonobacter sp.]
MNGETITRKPIPVDEGMAQRAAVETVCGNRGQADRRRKDQPGEGLRKPGGRRKKVTEKDARLGADLEEMLEPKGDPQSLVRWTSKSVSKLRQDLISQGHAIGETAIHRMLKSM